MREATLVVLLVLAPACVDSGAASPEVGLIGTWRFEDRTATFNADHTYSIVASDYPQDGMWNIDELGKLVLGNQQMELVLTSQHMMFGNLLRGSTEVAIGSSWGVSRSTPGGGGSCSFYQSSSSIALSAGSPGTEMTATYSSDSMCVPANMGGSHVRVDGFWTPRDDGFFFHSNQPGRWYHLGDAVGGYRWTRVP